MFFLFILIFALNGFFPLTDVFAASDYISRSRLNTVPTILRIFFSKTKKDFLKSSLVLVWIGSPITGPDRSLAREPTRTRPRRTLSFYPTLGFGNKKAPRRGEAFKIRQTALVGHCFVGFVSFAVLLIPTNQRCFWQVLRPVS